jgi:hypothetical protein
MAEGTELSPLLVKKPKFTAEDLENLCSSKYTAKIDPKDNEQTIKHKEEIAALAKAYSAKKAAKLAVAFKTGKLGTEGISRDLWKAQKYQNIATPPPKTPAEPPAKSLIEYIQRKLNYLKSLNKTDTVYQIRSWMVIGIRLLLVRIHRITSQLGHAFLPSLFSILGLGYGITFLIDLTVVLKVTFSPDLIKKERKEGNGFWKPAWNRFKNIITKDNRPYRMLNDAVWSLVNIIVFCTAGPLYLLLNPILNLVGFSFDLFHEGFWLGRHGYRHQQLVNKLSTRIEQKEARLTLLKQENDPTRQGDVITLENKIEKLKLIKDEMIKKRNEAIRRHVWITFWTAMVLLGMVMVYFPPTAIPGAFFIGCGISLLAGSVCTGVGRRFYLTCLEEPINKMIAKLKDFFKSTAKPSNQVKPSVSDNQINKTLSESGGRVVQNASASNFHEADGERKKTPPAEPVRVSSLTCLKKTDSHRQLPLQGDDHPLNLRHSYPF